MAVVAGRSERKMNCNWFRFSRFQVYCCFGFSFDFVSMLFVKKLLYYEINETVQFTHFRRVKLVAATLSIYLLLFEFLEPSHLKIRLLCFVPRFRLFHAC